MTLKIKTPPKPISSSCIWAHSSVWVPGFTADQLAARDAQWLELVGPVVEALKQTHVLISEAAATGFNCKDGDWAERLFVSQHERHAALRAITEEQE